MNDQAARAPYAVAVTAVLVCCTVLGLAGTDLVLPAVPGLPGSLGGTLAQSQLVLATFAAGTGVGLLLFGELGARVDQRSMLAVSLVLFALTSAAAALATSLPLLIALRFLQGVSASCAAVVSPGMVRALFSEQGAIRALGFLGSVESLAPAIAPIIGVWLLDRYGWQRGGVPKDFQEMKDDEIWWPRNNQKDMVSLSLKAGWSVIKPDFGLLGRTSLAR